MKLSIRVLVSLFAAALLVLPTSRAGAQTQTGTITGIVTDAQSAVLPGVTVTLSSPALITTQTAVSNDRGAYSFIALPPGRYSVRFELQGFSTVTRSDLPVNIAVVTTINQTLQVASRSESITVSGEAPAVDVKSTSVSTNFGRDLLESIPAARSIWSTVEEVPGATMSKFDVGGSQSAQQSSAQIHGSAPGQQEYAINGLKLNWPGGNGGATAFYFDQESIGELNVLTNGAPAEVATGGVYMNMVTRAGGNDLNGASSIFWEDGSFQGNNINDALRKQGIKTGNPTNYLYDFNANVGGPIARNRAWFFSSFRRLDISNQVLGVTRPDGSPAPDLNHQSNVLGKVTAQLNGANKISAEYNFNYQNRFFRRPTTDLVQEKASWRQIEPAYIAQLQWTSVLSQKLFLDARYGYLHLLFPLEYQPDVTSSDFAREDIVRATLSDAASYEQVNTATRNQVNVSASYFVGNWGGAHSFKTGMEYGRAFNQNAYDANGNYLLRYFDGAPLEVETYNTPLTSKNYIDTTAVYAQDSWAVNNRLTINYGGRFERLVGFAPAQSEPGNEFFPAESFPRLDNIPRWQDGMWRAGASYDVFGNGRTAIKAFAGRFMVQEGTALVEQVNPNSLGGDYRSWTDTNGDGVAQLSELGPPTRPYGGRVNKIDPNLKQPYSDEYDLGVDHQLFGNLSVGVTYYRRNNRQRFSGVNLAVPESAYTPVQVQGPNGPVTVYNQDPSTLGLANRVITNVPGLDDTYNGVEFTATKRMANRWQLLAGLTVGRDKGLYDRGLNDDFNNPNLNINRDNSIIGQDSTYIGKLVGTYILPLNFTVSTNLRYTTGQPVAQVITVRGLSQGTVSVLAQPVGAVRLDNVTLWDLRGSKIFTLGRSRMEATVDVFNLLNQAASTVINVNAGPLFGQPISILPPRIARLGLKFTF
jgi:hypothetical protein